MWIRRCQIDAKLEAPLPIPTQIVSNEEFIPPEQSPQQEEVEARTLELASEPARLQGMSRRQFLRTGSGMATGLMAFNQVFGNCFEVSAAEVEDQHPEPGSLQLESDVDHGGSIRAQFVTQDDRWEVRPPANPPSGQGMTVGRGEGHVLHRDPHRLEIDLPPCV